VSSGASRATAATTASASRSRRRHAALRKLGIEPPTIGDLARAALDDAIGEAERRSPGAVSALDAGCGRKSYLVPFRRRVARMVGVDLHVPDPPMPHLDEFAVVDLCGPGSAFPDATFDVVLSNFTLEHFADPPSALRNFGRWLKPGGTVVVTTVNRRHPFVAAYLRMPSRLQRRLQPLLKASAADAHPLVGACNEPALIRAALATAGFERIELVTVGNLGRAWGRRLPAFIAGAAGDRIAQGSPSRRSTILAVARRPAEA